MARKRELQEADAKMLETIENQKARFEEVSRGVRVAVNKLRLRQQLMDQGRKNNGKQP